MQQRVTQNRASRAINQQLAMREAQRQKLGEQAYREQTGIYLPLVAQQFKRYPNHSTAALQVLDMLRSQIEIDMQTRTLVMCAAIDIALGETELPLAS